MREGCEAMREDREGLIEGREGLKKDRETVHEVSRRDGGSHKNYTNFPLQATPSIRAPPCHAHSLCNILYSA